MSLQCFYSAAAINSKPGNKYLLGGGGVGIRGFFLIPNKRSAPAPKFIIIIIIIIINGTQDNFFLAIMTQNALSIRSTGESFVCLGPNPSPHPFLLVLVKEIVTQSSLAAGLWSFFKSI